MTSNAKIVLLGVSMAVAVALLNQFDASGPAFLVDGEVIDGRTRVTHSENRLGRATAREARDVLIAADGRQFWWPADQLHGRVVVKVTAGRLFGTRRVLEVTDDESSR